MVFIERSCNSYHCLLIPDNGNSNVNIHLFILPSSNELTYYMQYLPRFILDHHRYPALHLQEYKPPSLQTPFTPYTYFFTATSIMKRVCYKSSPALYIVGGQVRRVIFGYLGGAIFVGYISEIFSLGTSLYALV